MRIDAYNAVSQIYKTSSYSKNNKVVTNKKENDKYEISDTAKLYQVAKSAVASTSDVRMDMVSVHLLKSIDYLPVVQKVLKRLILQKKPVI